MTYGSRDKDQARASAYVSSTSTETLPENYCIWNLIGAAINLSDSPRFLLSRWIHSAGVNSVESANNTAIIYICDLT